MADIIYAYSRPELKDRIKTIQDRNGHKLDYVKYWTENADGSTGDEVVVESKKSENSATPEQEILRIFKELSESDKSIAEYIDMEDVQDNMDELMDIFVNKWSNSPFEDGHFVWHLDVDSDGNVDDESEATMWDSIATFITDEVLELLGIPNVGKPSKNWEDLQYYLFYSVFERVYDTPEENESKKNEKAPYAVWKVKFDSKADAEKEADELHSIYKSIQPYVSGDSIFVKDSARTGEIVRRRYTILAKLLSMDDIDYKRIFKGGKAESKKSESLTLKQAELKKMAKYGEAEDITGLSDAEAKELKKSGVELVGVSRGTYGMNGALMRGTADGKLYVITSRNSNLFYFV